MLPHFEVLRAKTLQEASSYSLLYGNKAPFCAGGTDLLVWMHEGVKEYPYVILLTDIPELHGIETLEDGSLSIGALTTFNEIVNYPDVKESYPYFIDAMNRIASYQVRNIATIGGNICSAVPSADSAPVLLVANALALLSDGRQERTVRLEDFFLGPRRTVLKPGELLVRFLIPAKAAGRNACFIKRGPRKAMTISMVCVACRLELEGNRITECCIALGAVAATPVRAKKAEEFLRGKEIDPLLLAQAAKIAAYEDCRPIDDVRASAAYRRSMVETMTKRALLVAAEGRE